MTTDSQELSGDRNGGVADQPATGRSKRRRWLFRLAALALPIVVLALIELALRIAGYGGLPPVLQPSAKVARRTYYCTSQAGVKTFFFSNLTVAGRMARETVIMPKPSNTVRVFALGGSAMRGSPQPRNLASTAFLQTMLDDLLDALNVEVINLGTTAIASFPVLCMAREALALDPDLLIVYSGNNEFFGAGGVASVHRFGRSTAAMKLLRQSRRTALVQWLLSLQSAPSVDARPTGNLMEMVVGDAQLPPDDPRRVTAAQNLKRHIAEIVSLCRQRGVPVIVCTLPANERDLAPIGLEVPPESLGPGRADFDQLYNAALGAMNHNPADALALFDKAEQLWPDHATLAFRKGRALSALGRDDTARNAYRKALNLDTMPWRAPESSNAAVRKAVGEYGIVCDLQRAFRDHSPQGVIGWELMDDHVHPSLRGQALIAETIVRTVARNRLFGLDEPALSELPEWQAYSDRLGRNVYDEYAAALRVQHMLSAAFFQRSNPHAVRRAERIAESLRQKLDPIALPVLKRWERQKVDVPPTGPVGMTMLEAHRYEDAERLFDCACNSVWRHSLLWLHYTWFKLVARRESNGQWNESDFKLAREIIETAPIARKVTSHAPRIDAYMGAALQAVGENKQAIKYLERGARQPMPLIRQVAARPLLESLIAVGKKDDARHWLARFLDDPKLTAFHQQLRACVNEPAETARP